MNSRLYVGEVYHERKTPLVHRFKYPVYGYVFDIDELEEIDKKIKLFGYNKLRPVSIRDSDYIKNKSGAIRDKLTSYLQDICPRDEIGKIELVTSARFFNYVFNPVSFYYCYKLDGELLAVVAEVNNTFGETHLYLFDDSVRVDSKFLASYKGKKDFHVSPFYNMDGDYRFNFSNLSKEFDISAEIFREGRRDFFANLRGEQKELNNRNLMKTLLKFPITASLTMPRILFQAAQLHYRKKLPVYTKPNPRSEMTVGVLGPTRREKLARSFLHKHLSKLAWGKLSIIEPGGEEIVFGDKSAEFQAKIVLKNYQYYTKVILGGDIGFGESYTDGDWESDNLTAVLELFIKNYDHFDDRDIETSIFRKAFDHFMHGLRKNTLKGSRSNIHAHYDLSNDLFETFLDKSMMYSAALFKKEDESLYDAQLNKLDQIINEAKIVQDHHVLEIGSGWGSFAIRAAKTTGCKVTTITISEEQYAYAKKRVKDEDLESQIEVKLCDYREITGEYDRIVSIEMIEAVGEQYLQTFFRTCDSLLKSKGRMLLQVITMPEDRLDAYRKSGDWIQKHIFPGCFVPSFAVIKQAIEGSSTFKIENVNDIGVHYAKTLEIWRSNFNRESKHLDALGFDTKFQRAWNYYFSYCEAGFSTQYLGDLHICLEKH